MHESIRRREPFSEVHSLTITDLVGEEGVELGLGLGLGLGFN